MASSTCIAGGAGAKGAGLGLRLWLVPSVICTYRRVAVFRKCQTSQSILLKVLLVVLESR